MGPLAGITVVEIAGIGPGPFCAMMLADMGAEVIRVDRAENVAGGDPASPPADLNNRGRRSVGVDLKNPDGVAVVLDLVERADALIEGFRPGVAERLGIGPEECLARNPKLVYGRMTGWGQDGPLAGAAGHDINYIALAGLWSRSGAGARRRCRRSTWWATSAAAACCWPSGWSAACWRRRPRARGRWSMRPWSTDRPCS